MSHYIAQAALLFRAELEAANPRISLAPLLHPPTELLVSGCEGRGMPCNGTYVLQPMNPADGEGPACAQEATHACMHTCMHAHMHAHMQHACMHTGEGPAYAQEGGGGGLLWLEGPRWKLHDAAGRRTCFYESSCLDGTWRVNPHP